MRWGQLLFVALCACALTWRGSALAQEPAAPAAAETPPSEPAAAPPTPAEPAPEKAENTEKSAKKRPSWKDRPGGINPCMTPDPGYGVYDEWSRSISMGQILAPQRGGVTSSGGFDLVVHFHGHYPVRKEFVKTARGIVLVAIDLGIGSGAYSNAFASPAVFEKLLESVKAEMARRSGKAQVSIRKLALSSWSAGYGAVQQILAQPAGKKVDAVLLLDSLHTGYLEPGHQLQTAGIEQFVDFAREAARGHKFMFQSYSSIIPPGYASTREVAHYIVQRIGGKVGNAKRADVLGLAMDERFDKGNYHVRGYLGQDKPDHCAHLGLMKDIVKMHLNRRWNPPKGFKLKGPTTMAADKRSKPTDKKGKAIDKHDKAADKPKKDKPKKAKKDGV
jgi:hypothetical protein